MKKNKIVLICFIMLMLVVPCASAHQRVTSELAPLINMYKAGNYTECYQKLKVLSKKDSNNALLYYYLGMSSAQLGKKDEAIANYEKASFLAEPESNLYRYSVRGKACAEGLAVCSSLTNEQNTVDDIFAKSFESFTEEARGEYEKLKLENLMREMNHNKDITPAQFQEFKDFSGMNVSPSVYSDVISEHSINSNISDIALLSDETDSKGSADSYNEFTDLIPDTMQAFYLNNL